MSYCRWSSDNFECDLYCYQSDDGYVTHVASKRVVGDVPPLPPWPIWSGGDGAMHLNQWIVAVRAQHDYVDKAERIPIGLPYDGETFIDVTLGEFLARLLHLREAGYRFPDSVLDDVREEMEQP